MLYLVHILYRNLMLISVLYFYSFYILMGLFYDCILDIYYCILS